jgi:hypothetical protein
MKAKQMLTERGMRWLFRQVRGRSFRVEVHQILVSRGSPRNLSFTREDIYTAEMQL